eukprot:TRINITY_DN30409_c0_g1_i1.p1 TRINITY_DN30409_c0_g1~~TRINITY_DN30409_c0_g1_i1.p1  ORF type:complete len:270 (-),score=70.74 TRINITY_DN30409_c0_g1_i1:2-811(-)
MPCALLSYESFDHVGPQAALCENSFDACQHLFREPRRAGTSLAQHASFLESTQSVGSRRKAHLTGQMELNHVSQAEVQQFLFGHRKLHTKPSLELTAFKEDSKAEGKGETGWLDSGLAWAKENPLVVLSVAPVVFGAIWQGVLFIIAQLTPAPAAPPPPPEPESSGIWAWIPGFGAAAPAAPAAAAASSGAASSTDPPPASSGGWFSWGSGGGDAPAPDEASTKKEKKKSGEKKNDDEDDAEQEEDEGDDDEGGLFGAFGFDFGGDDDD